MKAIKKYSWKKVFAHLLLLGLPTVVLAVYMLWDVNHYYNILRNDYIKQSIFFATGIGAAIIFYGYRFRFLPTVIILFAGLYFGYEYLNKSSFGEFDTFFLTIQF